MIMKVIGWYLLLESVQGISYIWCKLLNMKNQIHSKLFQEYVKGVSLFDICFKIQENQI